MNDKCVISVSTKKKCLRMAENGMTYREIYTSYYSLLHDTKYSGFRRMMQKWKKKQFADEEILEAGNLDYKFTPYATTVQVNKNGEITQSWIKSKASDELYLELIENIKNLPPILDESIQKKTKQKWMLEIPLYDMHWGIAEEKDYAEMRTEICNIIDGTSYEDINIIIGQDLFHNDDFRGRTSSGREIQKVDMAKAWNGARSFYYEIIKKAKRQSNRVRVIYSKGNHDESMSWAFVQMIKAEFGDSIEIDDSFKERKLITFGTNFIGITHADKIKKKPADLRGQFTITFPVEFSLSKVREIHAGHLHSESEKDEYGIMCRRLSSGNPTDEWHDENGFVGAHKRFTIFQWTLDKLAAIYYV